MPTEVKGKDSRKLPNKRQNLRIWDKKYEWETNREG
jgi:hypothetical protein